MANFFKNPRELSKWIRDKESLKDAYNELINAIKIISDIDFKDDELDIKDACTDIFNDDDQNASKILHNILSKHNLTEAGLNKGVYMKKKAQSRQRNDWMRGERNKWNRAVDGHKEETPWRIDRDQMFDFTHYTTDAISFDANPNRVYSGEALWRMYVMDKFYREYKTEDGKWVGGYINDRFHVFPTAGTPGNPDAPRDGGNQMQLGLNERTRKPRPHQYSTERRMEEARGNKTYDLEVTTTASSFNKIVKTANKVPVNRRNDKVYNIFTDCIEMKEAGIKYDSMLESISEHYDTSITDVAQIAKFANNMITKHDQIAYSFNVEKKVKTAGLRETFKMLSDLPAETIDPSSNTKVPINLMRDTVLVKNHNDDPSVYEVASGTGIGQKVFITDVNPKILEPLDNEENNVQEAAEELGLNDSDDSVEQIEGVDSENSFPVDEINV